MSESQKAAADIVIIGGCGHVGLPLGLAFAKAGKRVVALDIDEAKVESTNAGRMPFRDRGADGLLPDVLEKGLFGCTTDASVISSAEVVVTVIGTPVDNHLNPRFDLIQEMISENRRYLRSGQLLVLRSTLFPGTTERVARLLAAEGLDVDVAVCPERVAEGVALEEIMTLPQIVAGVGERARERAEGLFRCLVDDIIVMAPLAAELAKLFTNAWRYIQFATANQFYMIANDYGIDFNEVRRAMTQKYPRVQGLPSAGFAAGPCLFKDTMQLSAFHNNSFFLGHSAMLVNEGLPNYIVQRLARRYDLSKKTVGILGMTFKADCDDTRDSLSFKLRRILQTECASVLCSDPYLQGDWLTPLEDILEESDILIVGVPHNAYRDLQLPDLPVIDIWNATRGGASVV
ncbi:MAG: nucleotide sugar dehydrogenase [Planctomycetota bacterium]|jgi:UDP-N-acetyl-D-mannosaminuronic acid dehydrogenase